MFLLSFLLVLPFISAEQTCPDEDVNDDERGLCYKYCALPMTFNNANLWCSNRNYSLASIHSYDQNRAIAVYAQGNIDETYGMFWIGAENTGKWNWVDVTPFDYSNWDSGEPLYTLATLEMANAMWTTQHPTSTFPFVCAKPGVAVNPIKTTNRPIATDTPRPSLTPSQTARGASATYLYTSRTSQPTDYKTVSSGKTTATPAGPGGVTCPPTSKGNCPSDWTYFAATNGCYMRLFSESWSSAEDLCTQLGGHLASIHSKAEGSFIARLSRTNLNATAFNQMTWIGLSLSNTNKWVWSDGSKTDFFNWAPKYPIALPANPCVALAQDNQQESWMNGSCDILQRAYLCKKQTN